MARPRRRTGCPAHGPVWLTADEAVLRARVHTGGRYEAATAEERALMDSFPAPTERCQSLMVEALDELGLDRIDTGAGRTVAALVESVLDVVAEQGAAD